jgi:aspartate aminotransferase-like enzyme
MMYGMREALRRIVHEEGLKERWQRHMKNSQAFMNGVEAMGLGLHAEAGHRLPSLNSVSIPPGVSDRSMRATLLNGCNIEVGKPCE